MRTVVSRECGYARNPSESQHPNLWRGLCGWWTPLVNPRGGNMLFDLSHRANHGTLTSMSNNDWDMSRVGGSLDFDGVNDFVSISPSGLTSGGSAWTISLWEYPAAFGVGNFGTSISWGTTGGVSFQSAILANNGTAGNGTILIGQYGRNVLTTTTARPVNTWTHTAITYGGGTVLNAYQNGFPNGSGATNAFSITLTAAAIGRLQEGGQNYAGRLADVRIYNRALTPSEIRLLATQPGIGLQQELRSVFFRSASNRRRRLLTGMV